jgi:hypothetical protein
LGDRPAALFVSGGGGGGGGGGGIPCCGAIGGGGLFFFLSFLSRLSSCLSRLSRPSRCGGTACCGVVRRLEEGELHACISSTMLEGELRSEVEAEARLLGRESNTCSSSSK